MTIQEKIIQLGLELPPSPKAIASYIPANNSGKLVFTSGQLPLKDGKLILTGKLGKEVDMEGGKKCASLACLNALSAINGLIGDLNQISKIVKIGVFVAGVNDFTDQHLVANSASDLLVSILGDRGKHARFAVGVSALPLDAPVELEMIVEIQ